MKLCYLLIIAIAFATYQTKANEQIVAVVLKQNIYLSELTNGKGEEVELVSLIIPQLMENYIEVNQLSFKPEPEEIEQFKAWFAQKHPDRAEEQKKRTSDFLQVLSENLREKGQSEEQIKAKVAEYMEYSQNQPPAGESLANFVLPHWKYHIYFY